MTVGGLCPLQMPGRLSEIFQKFSAQCRFQDLQRPDSKEVGLIAEIMGVPRNQWCLSADTP